VLETQTTTPTSPVATVTKKRKKRVVEATKIHPHRRLTKPPLTGFRSAHPSCTSKNHRTQPSKMRRHQLTPRLHASGNHSCSLWCERDKEESFFLALVLEKKILMGKEDRVIPTTTRKRH
jgi:hypothetical protein